MYEDNKWDEQKINEYIYIYVKRTVSYDGNKHSSILTSGTTYNCCSAAVPGIILIK